MPWKKGQSGNPTGARKHHPRNKRTITELARDLAPEALKTLALVMKSPKSTMTARAIAADRILDRAWGKAPQLSLVSLDGAGGLSRAARDLTDAELLAIAGAALPVDSGGEVLELTAIEASDQGKVE